MHRCIQGRFAQTIPRLRFLPGTHDESSVSKILFSDNPALASQKFKNYIYLWRVSGAPRHALFFARGCCSYGAQWTEWSPRFDASSSMTLRQLVDWLRQTHHVPVKCLQYEGYSDPPLYDEKEARNEQKMNMVF
jgi:hypothetical protein